MCTQFETFGSKYEISYPDHALYTQFRTISEPGMKPWSETEENTYIIFWFGKLRSIYKTNDFLCVEPLPTQIGLILPVSYDVEGCRTTQKSFVV
jgi:hypothetical protein